MPWLRAATAAMLAAIEEATDSRVVMAAAEHSPESAELPLPEDGGLCNNRGYVRERVVVTSTPSFTNIH